MVRKSPTNLWSIQWTIYREDSPISDKRHTTSMTPKREWDYDTLFQEQKKWYTIFH